MNAKLPGQNLSNSSLDSASYVMGYLLRMGKEGPEFKASLRYIVNFYLTFAIGVLGFQTHAMAPSFSGFWGFKLGFSRLQSKCFYLRSRLSSPSTCS